MGQTANTAGYAGISSRPGHVGDAVPWPAAAAALGRVGVAGPLREKLADYGELLAWQMVPTLVRSRYKEAASLQQKIKKIVTALKPTVSDPGYGYVFWHPEDKALWIVLGDGDDQSVHQKWQNALKSLPGIASVRSESEDGPHGDPDWIRIKAGAALGWLNKPFEWGGALTGGPSPMSNALVGGLLGGGLGYAGGAIAEQFLPEKYVERGRLRKMLGLAGLGLGAAPGVWEGFANATNARQAGKPLGWRAAITPTNSVPVNPVALQDSKQLAAGRLQEKAGDWQQLRDALGNLDAPSALFLKAAAGYADAFDTGSEGLTSIPMDAFNQAIWNDVGKGVGSARNNPYGTKSPWGDNSQPMHTPPPIGAAAAGLVSGIGAQYGNPPMLSPQHFIKGLATAGVDMVTARVAGGVLGALGGLTPTAQEHLQNMGLWAGMVRGVTGSVLGLG